MFHDGQLETYDNDLMIKTVILKTIMQKIQ